MNFFSNYRFTLDIQKGKSQASIPVHHGDTGNRFYITLTDGGNPYIIPDGSRVDLYMRKPAPHNPLLNSCVIENNSLVRYEFNKNTASVEGMHKCELRLYSADGRLITTPSFVMVVDQRVVYDDEIGTEHDFNTLVAKHVIATEEARVSAEEAREKAEKARAAAELEREKAESARREYYDLVITSEEAFDECLYPLYKDEENLTRDQAVLKVVDDSAFNEPSSNFKAQRVLVRDVTFKKMRGYDDVRLHIFQPSIEYIKFENCRWETHWKVSGKNPRDKYAPNYNMNSTVTPEANGKPRATAFNRAKGNLHLTLEGIHVTQDNVNTAPTNPVVWGIGFRNIKSIHDCHIEYPENYSLTQDGYRALEISCQFFDYASDCSLSGYWDGTNVSNCRVNKIIKRCTNVSNVVAVNLLPYDGDGIIPVSIENCTNLVNLNGNISIVSCTNIGASKEEVSEAFNTAYKNAVDDAKKYLPKHTRTETDLGYKGIRLYGVDEKNAQVNPHAKTGYGANEIAIRDASGRLHARYSESGDDVDTFYGSWHKQTLMPKDYVDKKIVKQLKGYAPITDGKVPDTYLPSYVPLTDGKVDSQYLPSYVDEVVEAYHVSKGGHIIYLTNDIAGPRETATAGKIYVSMDGDNKIYRWAGANYGLVEISASLALGETSSTAYRGDRGKTAYEHSQITEGNPHGTTVDDIGAVGKLSWTTGGVDYRVYAQDNASGDEIPLWASEGATHSGADKTIAVRNASGQVVVGDPTNADHAANKEYVDSKIYSSEATDNNGAYGAAFSDERYFTKYAGNMQTGYMYIPMQSPDNNFKITKASYENTIKGSLVMRGESGDIKVAGIPKDTKSAICKEYYDNGIAEVKRYVDGVAVGGGESFEWDGAVFGGSTYPTVFRVPGFYETGGTIIRGIIGYWGDDLCAAKYPWKSFELYLPPLDSLENKYVHSNHFLCEINTDGDTATCVVKGGYYAYDSTYNISISIECIDKDIDDVLYHGNVWNRYTIYGKAYPL